MMDILFVENEIKKDIEECLKYYGFKNTSLCEHKVYVSKLDNLIGWEICVSFFNLGTSYKHNVRHNVKFMFFGIPVDSDTTLFKMIPLKSSLSTEQTETDFLDLTYSNPNREMPSMYFRNYPFAVAIDFQHKLIFDETFSHNIQCDILENYWNKLYKYGTEENC